MPEETILMHCSPVLAGIKTGNIFTYRCNDQFGLLRHLTKLNRELGEKGLRAIPLKVFGELVIIYIYRPTALIRDLGNPLAQKILAKCGYRLKRKLSGSDFGTQAISMLRERLQADGEFPHEIGLFLGYPPVDVMGFIRNKGMNCKCCGFWKVYGDEEQAQALFKQYRMCRKCYLSMYQNGASLEELAVKTG